MDGRGALSRNTVTAAEAEREFRPRRAPLVSLATAVGPDVARGTTDSSVLVSGVCLDSRAVQPGDLYAAMPGAKAHGAGFARQAVAAGAAAIVSDAQGVGIIQQTWMAAGESIPIPVVEINDVRGALGGIAARVFGSAHQLPRLMGVTGTNGKTTTTYMVRSLLDAVGQHTGLIGTIEIQAGHHVIPARLTTPEAPQLHALRARMGEAGVDSIAMEVSSHALEFLRVDGLVYDVAGFTNLTQDHLDLHGSMEHYFRVKAELFKAQRSRQGVVLVDDAWGEKLANEAEIPVQTVSVEGRPADWAASEVRRASLGHTFTLTGPQAHDGKPQVIKAHVNLPGDFNIANAAVALVMVLVSGVSAAELQQALDSAATPLTPRIPGRMEVISTQPATIVDFAHNPDALQRALASVRRESGRVIVVFGATGERDTLKRPLMGRIAADNADVVIVTDDDPHDEDPEQIRAGVLEGALQASQNTNTEIHESAPRADAIRLAISLAEDHDVILLAGRGHETVQEVRGVEVQLDDRVEAQHALAQRGTETRPEQPNDTATHAQPQNE